MGQRLDLIPEVNPQLHQHRRTVGAVTLGSLPFKDNQNLLDTVCSTINFCIHQLCSTVNTEKVPNFPRKKCGQYAPYPNCSPPFDNAIGVLGCTGSFGQPFLLLLMKHLYFDLHAIGASPRSWKEIWGGSAVEAGKSVTKSVSRPCGENL